MPDDGPRETGPWQNRVRFAPGGGFAYRPGEIIVNTEVADIATDILSAWVEMLAADSDESVEFTRDDYVIAETFTRFIGTFSVPKALEQLHSHGVLGQVNHVLFATSCCPPHPSDPCAESFYEANPFYANPFYANPFYANPFYANPFYANSGCGCGCGGGAAANPFYANPFYANPFYANASPSPFAGGSSQHSGARKSSARPADPPPPAKAVAVNDVRIAILDTGWADGPFAPQGLPAMSKTVNGVDIPDDDGDGFLDPAAGHGTFIAGLIEQLTPGCDLEVIQVLSTYGDGDEVEIAQALHDLSQRPEETRPHFVNLSFGGYSPLGMAVLARGIADLINVGSVVVASAGNDGTCLPLYPAAHPKVVGVGALDEFGKPAKFTNYGPWVNACAPGSNIVSLFFDGFNGAGPPENNYDPDDFHGWARWSGTSFSAPMVVAALAREKKAAVTARDTVKALIENQQLPRMPMLGTIVDPTA